MSDPTPHDRRPAITLAVLQVAAPSAPRGGRGKTAVRSIALRLYRLAVVVAIVWIIHTHRARLRIDEDAPIQVSEVQKFLPSARRLRVDESSDRLGLFAVDSTGKQIGYVLRTAPISNDVTGYIGPTDTLIVLDTDSRVVGITIRSSKDTPEHVQDVNNDDYFLKTWNGKTWDQVAGMDPRAAGIEGVSGASLTSLCIANGIQHRFQHSAQLAAQHPRFQFGWSDGGIVLVLIVATIFAFTHLRSHTWLRRAFQLVLIGYLGFFNGRLIAQSLLGGWAESGVPWRLAPGLVLLAGAALMVPWTTRRALYCSHVCPYGALQEWTGRLVRLRLRVRRDVDAGVRWLGFLLIIFVIAVTMLKLPFNLAAIEPFDAFLVKTAGFATIAIAVAGLVASAWVPMAYCKFGCPTGALLSFVRSHGKADRFGRKDIAAGMLVILTIAIHMRHDVIQHWIGR